MKVQRKLLTEEQRTKICDCDCLHCKLAVTIFGFKTCYRNIDQVEKTIKNFWNEEIEVEND